jgi:hypothetical protein
VQKAASSVSTGERESEAYSGSEANSQMVYLPASKLYLRGTWNLDASHAASARMTLPVVGNFNAPTPPLGYEMSYSGGVLDGKPGAVPKLQERFILTHTPRICGTFIRRCRKSRALIARTNGQANLHRFLGSSPEDNGVFAGHRRRDFSPEWKLRHFNPLTVTHLMRLGYRFFTNPGEENWVDKEWRFISTLR